METYLKPIFEEIRKIFGDKPLYITGGFCRDTLLNRKPKDIDFSTPLLPDEIENAIRKSGKKPYLVGKRFGTIGCKISINGESHFIEITSFRSEEYSKGSRKPKVSFVKDITADLSRRDLTINAIAIREYKIIDPFGGQDDLRNKKLRTVGKSTHRFKEDMLRTLRVARFASQLGFEIDEDIYKAVKNLKHKILEVSKERWMMELDKILISDNPTVGLDFLMETGLMKFMIPELALQYKYDQNSQYHTLDLWEHTKKALEATPRSIDLRWGMLLHDVGKPFVRTDKVVKDPDGKFENYVKTNYVKHDIVGAELVEKISKYLKWSNQRSETVKDLVKNHLNEDSPLREYDQMGK